MTKPGYLTTEFWLTVVVLILNNLEMVPFPDKYTWVVNVGALIGYAISRGLAKVTLPTVAAQLPVNYPTEPDADESVNPPAGAKG